MAAVNYAVLSTTLLGTERRPSQRETLQNLAHDLRQPLSTIEAIAYYLEMTVPVEQLEAREFLFRMQALVEQANSILDRAVLDA